MDERIGKFFGFFLLSLLLLSSTSVLAAKGFSVDYQQSAKGSKGNFDLEFKLTDYNIEPIVKNRVTYTEIDFPSRVVTTKKGWAELPFVNSSIVLNRYGNYRVGVVNSDYYDVKLDHPLLPSRGTIFRNQNPDRIPYVIDPNSVEDKWYPENIVQASRPYIIRDVRGMSVYAYPFQYNAKRNVLRIYKSISVSLIRSSSKSENSLVKNVTRINAVSDILYRTMFINYKSDPKVVDLADFGDMLVLHTARDAQAIKPYVNWKREKGFNVFTKEVSRGTNVKDIVKSAYRKNNDILYVQLVGDWEDIKSDLGPSNAPMDPMLGLVEGSDNHADLIVGRFTAKNAEDVKVQVAKTINYEKNPDMDGQWYKNGIGIASEEGGPSNGDDGESDQGHMMLIRSQRLKPYGYQTVHEDYARNGASASDVKQHIEAGVSIINYVGHGSATSWGTTGFNNGNISSLNNGNMLPVIFSVACVNGEFHRSGGDAFAEAWLKKENGGAVAAWMATINQPWAPPMRGQDYANDLLTGGYDYASSPGSGTTVDTQRTTFGSVAFNAAHLMYAEASQNNDLITIQTWTIFGDASLQMRTKTPKALRISNEVIQKGVPFVSRVTSQGQAVAGALVSLYQDGKSFTAISDANGNVEIAQDLNIADAKITVTAVNSGTISADALVVPAEGAYLYISEYSINDNNNNQADYGETVGIDATIENVGQDLSGNITLRLSSNSPYVRILDGEESVRDIAAGSGRNIRDGFRVSFDRDIADQTVIPMIITMYDSSSKKEYSSELEITVNAPAYRVIMGGSTVDPGDSADFTFQVQNIGHADATDLTVSLENITDLDITIGSGEQNYGSLRAGESAEGVFLLGFDSAISDGAIARIRVHVEDSYSIAQFYDFSLIVGMTENFESGDFTKLPWEQSGDGDWRIVEDSSEGTFGARSAAIDHDKTTSISFEQDISSAGEITFYRKVSSEARYDKLSFYIDGELKGDWSGIEDWAQVRFAIDAGTHTFKWEYSKDRSVSKNDDSAWIDQILIVN